MDWWASPNMGRQSKKINNGTCGFSHPDVSLWYLEELRIAKTILPLNAREFMVLIADTQGVLLVYPSAPHTSEATKGLDYALELQKPILETSRKTTIC